MLLKAPKFGANIKQFWWPNGSDQETAHKRNKENVLSILSRATILIIKLKSSCFVFLSKPKILISIDMHSVHAL